MVRSTDSKRLFHNSMQNTRCTYIAFFLCLTLFYLLVAPLSYAETSGQDVANLSPVTGLKVVSGIANKDNNSLSLSLSWNDDGDSYQISLFNKSTNKWRLESSDSPNFSISLTPGKYLLKVRSKEEEGHKFVYSKWSDKIAFSVSADLALSKIDLLQSNKNKPKESIDCTDHLNPECLSSLTQEQLIALLKKKVSAIKNPKQILPRRVQDELFSICWLIDNDNRERALEALRPLFAHWEDDYKQLIYELQKRGYFFKDLNNYHIGQRNQKIVFIRYDIHMWDVLPALGFIYFNEKMNIPSVFYILWDHTPYQVKARNNFLLLKKYRGKLASFGFHSNPAVSALIRHKFNGDVNAFIKWSRGNNPEQYLRSLVSEKGIPLPVFLTLIKVANYCLTQHSESFCKHFPNARTITSHGSPLGGIAIKLFNENPTKYHAIKDFFHSNSFLDAVQSHRRGWAFEATNSFGNAPRIIYDGNGTPSLSNMLCDFMANNNSMILLLHPSKFQREMMNNFFITPFIFYTGQGDIKSVYGSFPLQSPFQ